MVCKPKAPVDVKKEIDYISFPFAAGVLLMMATVMGGLVAVVAVKQLEHYLTGEAL